MDSIRYQSAQYGPLQQFSSLTVGAGMVGGSAGCGCGFGFQLRCVNFQLFDIWSALLGFSGGPFFGGFLEGQKPGGGQVHTMAYPSDSDQDVGLRPPGPGNGLVQTMRYPSDSDDDVGFLPPGPGNGLVQTMRYPSDSDDDAGFLPPGPGNGLVQTMRYPSDSDDDGGMPFLA